MDDVLAAKIIYDLALVGAIAFAFALGGWSERVGATIAVLATGATSLVWPVAGQVGFLPRYGYVTVDVLALVAFDALMVRSRAFWPVWVTALQLLAVALDLAVIATPERAFTYRLIEGKLAYPVLVAIMLGSWRAHRRRRVAS